MADKGNGGTIITPHDRVQMVEIPLDFPCDVTFGDVEIKLHADGRIEGDFNAFEQMLMDSRGLGMFAPLAFLILQEWKRQLI